MDQNWMPPRVMIGGTAEGDRYFRRPDVEFRLWREIRKGNHVLFSAPRRVGKSSVMKYMASKPEAGFACTYQNISSDNTAQAFYRRIFELAIAHVKAPKTAKVKDWLRGIGVEEVSFSGGLKLSAKEMDFKVKLLELLPNLKEEGLRIVLFLDEFPDVIRNVAGKEGAESAKDILQTLRGIRHNDSFKGHFNLVLAGSVGLDHVVREVDRLAVINDLYEQNLGPLSDVIPDGGSHSEAEAFIMHLVKGASMKVSKECRRHLIDKLKTAVPFYIQLLIEACDEILDRENRPKLKDADIDAAWEKVLKDHRNFADWDDRLREYFPVEYPYFHEVLTIAAHHPAIDTLELFDLGNKHGLGLQYKALLDDVLIKDGYLYQEGTRFQFVSPLLRAWWQRRHPHTPKS